MFYLIETNDQLKEFKNLVFNEIFVEPIFKNDYIHPSLNEIISLYIKPLDKDKGYILNINHNDALCLDEDSILDLLTSFNKIFVLDKKSILYFYQLNNLIQIENLNITKDFNTKSHLCFYNNYRNFQNINSLIPIVKHYEKCELLFNEINSKIKDSINFKYTDKLQKVFFFIEKNGLRVDLNNFNKFFNLEDKSFSLSNDIVYTHYNLNTTTGRPSNSFNGINFAALNKENGCRKSFIPKNDYFIEIDINSYHPVLAGQLVGFDFKNQSPYEYFAERANVKLKDAKTLMFRQLYGGIYNKYKNIDFFKKVDIYVNKMWNEFMHNGYIECPISKQIFSKNLEDINPQKLFNYLLQNRETSNNVEILWEICKLLLNKNTQLVLTTYDSFLFDLDENELDLLNKITDIFKNKNLKIKMTKGKNYGEMELYGKN